MTQDLCDDNRFELIEKYKKRLIEATNIEESPEEMTALDNILFRFWQMGWLDKLELPSAQRKTGNWKWGFADNGWADWTCSECGWTENNDIHVSLGYKYCPHCGAYMEGVIPDEEKNKRYKESFEKEESYDN